MKILTAILILTLCCAAAIQAQSPEEVTALYFQKFQHKQWKAMAELFDTAGLAEFRETMSFLDELPEEAAEPVLGRFFGEETTRADAAKMNDRDFFAAFLAGVMKQASLLGGMDLAAPEVLGSVKEGELRHVLTRSRAKVGEIELESMEVLSFRQSGGQWKLLMQGKLRGLAQQLRKAFAKQGARQ